MKLPPPARRSGLSSLALLGAALPAGAEVWVVDNVNPAQADFVHIQPAILAAADGDTVLVRGGGDPYHRFVVAGKGLTVVAATHGVEVVLDELEMQEGSQPAVQVREIAGHQEVVVRGFHLNYGVLVEDCAGDVWLDELRVEGADLDGICSTGGTHGAEIRQAANVTITHCALVGEAAGSSFHPMESADGLVADHSTVRLFDCDVVGGAGASGWAQEVQPGGAGLRIVASQVTASGCTVRGGPGGMGPDGAGEVGCAGDHAEGGPGVALEGTGAVLVSRDSILEGGAADFDALCPGLTGPSGPDVTGAGTLVEPAGAARHLRANAPAGQGERVAFRLAGVPGELAVVLLSAGHAGPDLADGLLLVDPAGITRIAAGRVPETGEARVTLPVPSLGALEALTLYAQGAFLDATPTAWMGGGAAVVLLDPAR